MAPSPQRVLVVILCTLIVGGISAVVPIPAGEGSAQDIVDANPPGTTYSLASGMHRYFSVKAKDGDTYVGEPGAVVSGGRILTDWEYNGKLYYVTNQTQQGQTNGDCLPDWNCMHPEDLFMDERPLQHVMNLSVIATGGWFFDYDAHIIYMFDNPKGHMMETSVTRVAVYGSANNVTVKNLFVEKYAIPAQFGAIGDQYPGQGWVVSGCTVTRCHGTGINVASYGQITGNNVTLNGQKGVGCGGDYPVVEGNSISFNNYAGFNPGWEAGGSKCAFTRWLTVRNNHSFNNTGDGLWTDISNIFTTYDGNVVEYNQQNGISHEISYNATISNNFVRYNGYAFDVWLWGSQILIQNSQNVKVFNNTVVMNSAGNGISIIYQNRGSGPYGPWIPYNNFVHDNHIYHTYKGESGAVQGVTDYEWLFNRLTFDANHYHVPDLTRNYWKWNNTDVNWTEFRAGGGAAAQEPTGTIDTNNTPPEPFFLG